MATRFHVTSTANRESIARYGLDWTRMGAARGIAGSTAPEVQGCFLAEDEWSADYFVRLNNTGGPVDVWEVSGIEEAELLELSGYAYLPAPIHRGQVRLVRTDLSPVRTRKARGRVDRPAQARSSSYPVPPPSADGRETARRRRSGPPAGATSVG